MLNLLIVPKKLRVSGHLILCRAMTEIKKQTAVELEAQKGTHRQLCHGIAPALVLLFGNHVVLLRATILLLTVEVGNLAVEVDRGHLSVIKFVGPDRIIKTCLEDVIYTHCVIPESSAFMSGTFKVELKTTTWLIF